MLIGVNPAETVWRTWTELQRERIALDRTLAEQRRRDTLARLGALTLGEEAIAAALRPLDDLLARLAQELSDLSDRSDRSDPSDRSGEPEFQLGHLAWKIRGRIRALYGTGKLEDATTAVELLVRHGSRGHRNFRDASGAEIPVRFESSSGDFPVLSVETFECYASSGVAEALASAILAYNSFDEARRKN